jgi:4-methyl-5(b-hydroxyethyl)-thiazole monophosphate biosynthesis
MPKVLVLLVEGFEEIEAFTVVDVLRRAGAEVVVAGYPGNIIKGAHDVRIVTDARLIDLDCEQFDVLVLPGGYPGYLNLLKSERVLELTKNFVEKGKLVCAICAAPLVLAKLGYLKERRATIYPGFEKELGRPRDEKVVIDENIITSQGPGTAMHFAFAIVEKLFGKTKAEELKEKMVFKC